MESQNKGISIISKGTSLKFCIVAEGKADIYLRFAPTMEWDTVAGHTICNALVLRVMQERKDDELCYIKKNY